MHLVRSSGHEHNRSPYHDQDAMDVDQTCITRIDSEREKWWRCKDSSGALATKSSVFACFGIRWRVACLPFLIRVPMSSHIAIDPRAFPLSLPSHTHTFSLFSSTLVARFFAHSHAVTTQWTPTPIASKTGRRHSLTGHARTRASCLLCPSPLRPCRIANIAHPFEAIKLLRTRRPSQPHHPLSLARARLHLIVL